MLTLNQVQFYYRKGQSVLDEISFAVKKREFLAIVGGNGSGKSTLAKLMKGLLLPKKGSVQFNKLDTTEPEVAADIHRRIGIVFQNPDDQFITTTVTDEIVFGMENLRIPLDEMHARLNLVLKAVGLENEAEAMPHQLSGGQKQRAAIAAVLAMQPDMIILDEATSMLDPEGRQQMLLIMQELHRQGVTIVHITHHMDEVLHADRVLLLHEGHVAYDGTPAVLFETVALADYGLHAPFAVRLRQSLSKAGPTAPLMPDWKEWTRSQWSMR
ncbi:energy-coupling factor transporter ATPase [Paenibacillus glucanolyticus]|uniref:energy-coupling factor transporter ATPase n=1 Tax=Paenibacillus glucanolyticus TaxID=59843 RepID=UPI0034CEEDD6